MCCYLFLVSCNFISISLFYSWNEQNCNFSCTYISSTWERERAYQMFLNIIWVYWIFSSLWGLFFWNQTDHDFQYLTSCARYCCREVITGKLAHCFTIHVWYIIIFSFWRISEQVVLCRVKWIHMRFQRAWEYSTCLKAQRISLLPQ